MPKVDKFTDTLAKRLHRRITARDVFEVLKEHKAGGGTGLRFRDIKLEMLKKGILHSDTGIYFSYMWLVSEGLVVKNGRYYSIADGWEAKLNEQKH